MDLFSRQDRGRRARGRMSGARAHSAFVETSGRFFKRGVLNMVALQLQSNSKTPGSAPERWPVSWRLWAGLRRLLSIKPNTEG